MKRKVRHVGTGVSEISVAAPDGRDRADRSRVAYDGEVDVRERRGIESLQVGTQLRTVCADTDHGTRLEVRFVAASGHDQEGKYETRSGRGRHGVRTFPYTRVAAPRTNTSIATRRRCSIAALVRCGRCEILSQHIREPRRWGEIADCATIRQLPPRWLQQIAWLTLTIPPTAFEREAIAGVMAAATALSGETCALCGGPAIRSGTSTTGSARAARAADLRAVRRARRSGPAHRPLAQHALQGLPNGRPTGSGHPRGPAIAEVVSRNQQRIVVRHSGRP